ncbi:hypothetical protein ACQP00_27605 [Dactylosporangium sp. CS-047395]|uniref:hypothetical protein n=1 Tax=Dactylosporangium sp. CS-047395 TaxID=3239936 RepID=UPI003D94691D
MLELPIGEPSDVAEDPPGIRSDSVPATLSKVTINLNDRARGVNSQVALHGGLIGVAQDAGGALQPIAGWHVAAKALEIDDVIDRIVAGHETTPGRDLPADAPADVIGLYRRLGTASLFGGRWRLRPVDEHRGLNGLTARLWAAERLFDLDDGRSIIGAPDIEAGITYWIVGRVRKEGDGDWGLYFLADDPAEVPVLGTSLAMLLDAALDSGGDITHLRTGWLSELIQ